MMSAAYAGHLEGPAVFYSPPEQTYYLWTSHTSGWDGSPAVVHCAAAMNASTCAACCCLSAYTVPADRQTLR